MDAQQDEQKDKLDETLTIALDGEMRKVIKDLANSEDRKVGSMGRILLREALQARGLYVGNEAASAA